MWPGGKSEFMVLGTDLGGNSVLGICEIDELSDGLLLG